MRMFAPLLAILLVAPMGTTQEIRANDVMAYVYHNGYDCFVMPDRQIFMCDGATLLPNNHIDLGNSWSHLSSGGTLGVWILPSWPSSAPDEEDKTGWFETEWVCTMGLTQRVRTPYTRGNTSSMISARNVHGRGVRLLMGLFPPNQ